MTPLLREFYNYLQSKKYMPTHKEIMKDTGLSHFAVEQRMKRLREIGAKLKPKKPKSSVIEYRGQLADALGMNWEV